ncbi:MAG: S8 family serine peptidase [Candidatus Promineifilaceae bacterium]|nr:S8 family serine peptidase [Candidatus Promineifilaceae bacterium]
MLEDRQRHGALTVTQSAPLSRAARHWSRLWLLITLCLLIIGLPVEGEGEESDRLGPALTQALAESTPDDPLRVLIYLDQQPELPRASRQAGTVEARQALVNDLQLAAAASQVDLLQTLKSLSDRGQASQIRPLWIVNAVSVRIQGESLSALAHRSDVAAIRLDQSRQYVEENKVTKVAQPSEATWGVAQVRAIHTWNGLGVTGEGVTIAIMDTGADWRHPALKANYRGVAEAGGVSHAGHWFDAVEQTPAPIDPHGHGTHVTGTTVGMNGIGVAPGAQWIAVRMLDRYGFGYTSDILLAFQWLLAPNGDVSLSPDIVNGSWSGAPQYAEFKPAIAALRAAGIIPVFAAGNSGPEQGSVGSPAAYDETVAIGASDDKDEAAWFSARGPSLWAEGVKPDFVAPGTAVLSSLPGDEYGRLNGTSMAAPHASGILALLKAADPQATTAELLDYLRQTAHPIGNPVPNNDTGWGRLDAYAAVAKRVAVATLNVSVSTEDRPLAGATVIVTMEGGQPLSFTTDADGQAVAFLRPGSYLLAVQAYGFARSEVSLDDMAGGQSQAVAVRLERLPHGVVQGVVQSADRLDLLRATIDVSGTPVVATSAADGAYRLELPAGDYQLLASLTGYRLETRTVTVTADETVEADFVLTTGPRILLVDSGAWLYQSQAPYYAQALADTGYSHDSWPIDDPYTAVPTGSDLEEYEAVIWSAPYDAPSVVGAAISLADYLDQGGHLLVSGQDVAYYESLVGFSLWWYEQLRGRFVEEKFADLRISGVSDTSFADLSFELNGAASANNQSHPDAVAPQRRSLTQPILRFPDGQGAGLQSGLCQPFRLVQLGFGLEGVNGTDARRQLVERTFAYFDTPRQPSGLLFQPDSLAALTAADSTVSFDLRLVHTGEIITDTLSFSVQNTPWDVELSKTEVTMGPCTATELNVTVPVPADAPPDTRQTFTIEAVSANFPDQHWSLPVQIKTPGRMLLVDDDRWYDQQAVYRAALDAGGYPYDVWDTSQAPGDGGSPPGELLNAYETVIWYTGADWFQPVTTAESERLRDYLAQGGRLLLSSQDYLDYHLTGELTRDYFGIEAFEPSVELSGVVAPEPVGPFAELDQLLPLGYEAYQRSSDALLIDKEAQVALRYDGGQAAAAANRGLNWSTLFLAFPLELLSPEQQGAVIDQALDWLGELGNTSFTVDNALVPKSGGRDSVRTFTLTLSNHSLANSHQIEVSNVVPEGLTVLRNSVTGGASFDQRASEISWSGQVPARSTHTISYRARVAPNASTNQPLLNEATVTFDDGWQSLKRRAAVWLETPDLRPSTLSVTPGPLQLGDTVELRAVLRNVGATAETVRLHLRLPSILDPEATVVEAESGSISLNGGVLNWIGGLARDRETTIRVRAPVTYLGPDRIVPVAAVVDDAITPDLFRLSYLHLDAAQSFLPLTIRSP